MGSFLNAWIWRTRENLSVASGRSMCPHCRQRIAWYDNIPVISWLILKGKCRKCRMAISIQYPVVEFICGVLFLFVAVLRKGSEFYSLEMIRDCIIVFFLLFIFIYDYKHQEIPDKASLPLAVILFFVSLAERWHSVPNMFLGIAVGGGFFFVQYYLSNGRWIGGGDVRLGLLMGVILGWPNILAGLIFAYVFGAAVSVIQIAFKKKNLKSETPFGVYLTLGTFVMMFWGDKLVGWYIGLLK